MVVTRHDILKIAALLLMLIDHIGMFFFPDDMTWRAIGRASAPIWLFLVGYNLKSKIDVTLWGGALLMTFANLFVFDILIPLNILVSIILVRITLPMFPVLMQPWGGFKKWALPGSMLLVLAMLLYPTELLWEYGAFAWLLAAWGWWQRQAEDAATPYAAAHISQRIWVVVVLSLYMLHYIIVLQLTFPLIVLQAVAVLAVAVWLLRFRAGPLAWQPGGAIAKILHFCGRQTLLLYVVHYLLLGFIAKYGLLKGLL